MKSDPNEYGLRGEIPSVSASASDLKAARRARNVPPRLSADRVPPHSPEAEQGLCGCALLEPSRCLDELHEQGVQPGWCYDLRHEAVLAALFAMHEKRLAVDLVTLQQWLKDRHLLEQVGGIAYLAALPDAVPSATNLSYYVDIVREKFELRTMLGTCRDIVSRVNDFEGDVDALKDSIERDLGRLAEIRCRQPARTLREVLLEVTVPELEAHYHRGKAQLTGLTSGFEYLDKIYSGMGGENGNYLCLAARPGIGKTTIATQIALHAAMDYVHWDEVSEAESRQHTSVHQTGDGKFFVPRTGVPVGIFSLEMSFRSLARRMLFQRAGADLQRWKTGFATKADLPPLHRALEQVAAPTSRSIFVDDDSDGRIHRIAALARRWHRKEGVRFFVIDYFQLLVGDRSKKSASQVEEMEGISKAILALSKDLNCPFLVLTQMNRDWEKDQSRPPQLSDLKGCGAIEQDAHVITFLYKPRLTRPGSTELTTAGEFFEDCMERKFGPNWKKWNGRPVRVNALVAKNREGETGPAELLFERSCGRFHDWNVWLKQNNFKAAAAGEESRYQGQLEKEET